MYPLPGNNWLLVKILLILDVDNDQNIHFVILPQVPEFSVKQEKGTYALKNVNFAFYDFMHKFLLQKKVMNPQQHIDMNEDKEKKKAECCDSL